MSNNNRGETLITFAAITAAIQIIGGVIIAIAIFIGMRLLGRTGLGAFLALLIIAGSVFLAIKEYLLLFCVGETYTKTQKFLTLMTELQSAKPKSGEKAPSIFSAPGKAAPAPRTNVTCPFCKTVYPLGTVYCEKCDAQIGAK